MARGRNEVPAEVRIGGETFLVVPARDVLELHDRDDARRLLKRVVEDRVDLEALRRIVEDLDADAVAMSSSDVLARAESLLASGRLVGVRVRRKTPALDSPEVRPLVDPDEPQEPQRGRDRPRPIQDPDEPVRPPSPSPPDPRGEPETTWYEIRVVDELGVPIEGAVVSLTLGGSRRRLVADSDGRVRIDDATTVFAVAGVTEIDSLREILRTRWAQVRDGEWLDETEDHFYIECCGALPPINVRAGRVHTIVLLPRVVCARLLDLLFDTNKAFLLPSALEHIPSIRKLYEERPDAELLIVGHTDPTGDPSINDPLSLARAESVRAYLMDDVDAWLAHYEPTTPAKARWGSIEDQRMLEAVLARSAEGPTQTPLRHFQATRGLEDDGVLGPLTRRALITEYMALDGTTLPTGIDPIVHGCGESFARDDEPETDADEAEHAFQRRVELFFFDGMLGVLPPPQGEVSAPGSREYPEWRRRSSETRNYVAPPDPSTELALRLHDEDRKPMAGARFVVAVGGGVPFHGHSDEDGFVFVRLPPVCPERIRVRWGEHPVFEYAHELDVFPDCYSGDLETRNSTRLHNLGYAPTVDLEAAVRQFQGDYDVDADPEPVGLVDGTLPPDSQERLDAIWLQKNSNATRA